MSKRRKVVLRFEDMCGDRMDLFLVEKKEGFQVFARHTQRKVVNEGATTDHKLEKAAETALEELAQTVRARGWEARLPKKHVDDPAPMRMDEDGNRLFRDARTGEYRRDESASEPPKVKVPDTTKPKKEPKPEPKLDELLKQ